MPDQQNITNIPSNRVEFIDPRTGLVSREWYRFFLNLFNLAGAGGNQISLDEMQIGPPPQPVSEGGGGGTGTVTSVAMTVPTGLDVSGSPITNSGTFAVTYAAGYDIPTTASQAQWDTAYTDRLKWDGGATDLVASTGRISLGATTVGGNFFTLPNPSAITFVQINADNTITTMDAPTFRTAIGAGTGAGSVTSVDTAGTVNGLTLTGGPITTSGTITLGGTLDLSSPPAIGSTTPAAGTFTTLTATGQTDLGGPVANPVFRVNSSTPTQYLEVFGSTTGTTLLRSWSTNGSSSGLNLQTRGSSGFNFSTNGGSAPQFNIANTTSAVNYVQVTGAATGGNPSIQTAGSDANRGLSISSKGTSAVGIYSGAGTYLQFQVVGTNSAVNYLQAIGTTAGNSPSFAVNGSDTNIDLTLTPKGTGVVRTSGTGIRLYGSSSGYVGLKGAAAAGSTTYTLPAADGTTGQMLSTNGSGTLSWATGGGSNITAQGLWENSATISADYSITSGNNALSSGPVTVATGVTVTVPSGSVWTIV